MNSASYPNNHEYGYGNIAAAQQVYRIAEIFERFSFYGQEISTISFSPTIDHGHDCVLYNHACFIGLIS
jgi:hypothetical protein